jgi:hypothetical protein
VFVGLSWVVFDPFEPRYQGKRLSQWADILALPYDAYPNEEMAKEAQSHQPEAEKAIRCIGIRALPYAIKWSQAKGAVRRGTPHDWLDEIRLFGVEVRDIFPFPHQISAEDLHERSWLIFRLLGTNGKSEIPILIDLLGDKDAGVGDAAAGDLCEIGPDVVGPLTAALTNQNVQTRRFAASLFELPSLATTSAIPALVICLSDPDSMVRLNAALALGLLRTNAPPTVVPPLLAALKRETNLLTKLSLIDALGQCGTNAQTAVPVLKRILESQPATPFSPSPQRGALSALRKIDSNAAQPFFEQWKANLTNGAPLAPVTP